MTHFIMKSLVLFSAFGLLTSQSVMADDNLRGLNPESILTTNVVTSGTSDCPGCMKMTTFSAVSPTEMVTAKQYLAGLQASGGQVDVIVMSPKSQVTNFNPTPLNSIAGQMYGSQPPVAVPNGIHVDAGLGIGEELNTSVVHLEVKGNTTPAAPQEAVGTAYPRTAAVVFMVFTLARVAVGVDIPEQHIAVLTNSVWEMGALVALVGSHFMFHKLLQYDMGTYGQLIKDFFGIPKRLAALMGKEFKGPVPLPFRYVARTGFAVTMALTLGLVSHVIQETVLLHSGLDMLYNYASTVDLAGIIKKSALAIWATWPGFEYIALVKQGKYRAWKVQSINFGMAMTVAGAALAQYYFPGLPIFKSTLVVMGFVGSAFASHAAIKKHGVWEVPFIKQSTSLLRATGRFLFPTGCDKINLRNYIL